MNRYGSLPEYDAAPERDQALPVKAPREEKYEGALEGSAAPAKGYNTNNNNPYYN